MAKAQTRAVEGSDYCDASQQDALSDGTARFALSQAIDVHLAVSQHLGPLFDHDQTALLIFLDLLRASVSHINSDRRPSAIANAGLLPDQFRIPVSMLAISSRTQIPYETVRRHTLKLVERGLCERIGNQGFLIPARVLDTVEVRQATLDAADRAAASAKAIQRSLVKAVPRSPSGRT